MVSLFVPTSAYPHPSKAARLAGAASRACLCADDDASQRFASRVTLTPGKLPPKFVGEVPELTCAMAVPAGYTHGKVVVSSYLLQQLATGVSSALFVFGDLLSDAYLSYDLYINPTYAMVDESIKHAYYALTKLSFILWLLISTVLVAVAPADGPLQSCGRRAIDRLCDWLVVAFNFPNWLLLLTEGYVVKAFAVSVADDELQHGLVVASSSLATWKKGARFALLAQLPSLLIEDVVLTALNVVIKSLVGGWTFTAGVVLFFSLAGLVKKGADARGWLRAACCSATVNAQAEIPATSAAAGAAC